MGRRKTAYDGISKMNLPLRKLTIFSLLLALAAWGAVGVYLLYTEKVQPRKEPAADISEDIRQQVLTSLEEDLEFCQIVKEGDVSKTKKEFWLICNGRPFYALYEDGKVSYELNGWSFLKDQPEILKELQDNQCRLYQTTDDYTLSFICEQDENVRKYSFSTSGFKLTKTSEDTFINSIFGELLETTLPSCDFLSLDKAGQEGYWAMKIQCLESEAVVYFDSEKLFFTLPVISDESLTDRERVKKSVEMLESESCNLQRLMEIGKGLGMAFLICNENKRLPIIYDLNQNKASFMLEKEKFIDSYALAAQYNYPFLKDIKVEKLILEQDEPPRSFYYLSNKRVLIAERDGEGGVFSQPYLKDESFD